MARYIDVDALKLDIDLSNGATVVDMALSVIRAVKEAPTADVVPKSEVENEIKNWQELYADTVRKWDKAYEELEIKLENAKAEVEEIFDEIEKEIDSVRGLNFALQSLEHFIAELKKKYQEGEPNGQNIKE